MWLELVAVPPPFNSPHTRWAGMLPRLRPLPAGRYGIPCYRGPSFEQNGFGDVDSGQDLGGVGVTCVPSLVDLRYWAELYLQNAGVGCWSPWRSHVVKWSCKSGNYIDRASNISRHDSSLQFYSAGDGGHYDLCFDKDHQTYSDLSDVDPDGLLAQIMYEKQGGQDCSPIGSAHAERYDDDIDDISCGSSLDSMEVRRAAEHDIFCYICRRFEMELCRAMMSLDYSLSEEVAQHQVQSIVLRECTANQEEECKARLVPMKPRIVWSTTDQDHC